MAKANIARSEPARSATASVAERASASEPKGSINLRIEATTRQLIDDAAAVQGKTRTEFMIESVRRRAVDVLLDQRLFTLDPERYDALMRALDNPPRAGTEAQGAAAPDSGMAEIGDTPDYTESQLFAPVPLTAEHDLSAFDCGEPALNDWLRHRALKNESRFSRTYVVCARATGWSAIFASRRVRRTRGGFRPDAA